MASILVVCTGNICRSPMAEALLGHRLQERGIPGMLVSSAGVMARDGGSATPEAVLAQAELGIDISQHLVRRLAGEMVDDANLILAMTEEHSAAVLRMAPHASGKTYTLKELVNLLDHQSLSAPGPGPDERVAAAVDAADRRRSAREVEPAADLDIADPLGLGLEAYRATAWELDQLIGRLLDAVFPLGIDAPSDEPASWEGEEPLVGLDGTHTGASSMKDFVADWDALKASDPDVAGAIADEVRRERSMLRLIASENYASPAVLAALASTFNNKYAEGYPGKRYYGGCEFVDVVETLAIDRAKALFGAEHANVQPHAGAQANLAVYGAFLDPRNDDEKVLGLVLAHGGHLTHGSPVNVSGKWFHFVGYEVDKETELIDMDRVRDLALEHRPRIILAGFTAYPRVIDFEGFRRIADEVEAIFMVDASHFIGLVAGGAYPSPVPFADVVTFTTHKTLRGARGAAILCRAEHAKAIDKAVFPMMQGGPLENAIAGKAVALKEAMQPGFKEYAHRTVRTARALAAALADEGVRIVSGGTDSHLALIDLQPIGMTGADAERLCEDVGIALNKNAIPFDPLPPGTASGIRVGTPGPATLGMDEPEMKEIGRLMGEVLRSPDDRSVQDRARAQVRDLMDRFPPYPG